MTLSHTIKAIFPLKDGNVGAGAGGVMAREIKVWIGTRVGPVVPTPIGDDLWIGVGVGGALLPTPNVEHPASNKRLIKKEIFGTFPFLGPKVSRETAERSDFGPAVGPNC